MISLKKWMDENNLALIFITIYFLLSIIKIEHPGVNNDQLMFVNSATLNPDNFFLWKSFHGIPIMIFPYIGALKSYLYMPIFYFFGVNIWSIRLPQIILISISWFIFYKALIISFNKKIALLTILFLSIDPSIIVYSKVDQGPTVLEFFLKIMAIYLLFFYLKTKRSIFYFSIFLILALGIFNKLNFIWFANAFLISFVIFYWKIFYNDFKRFDKLFPFFIIILPYFFLLKLFLKLSREVTLSYKNFAGIDFSNIAVNVSSFQDNLINLINGNIFFNIIYGYNPTSFGIYFSFLIFLILFIGGLLIIKNKFEYKKDYLFFVLTIVLIILQLFLTKNAVSAWHTMSIYPLFTLLFVSGLTKIYSQKLVTAILIIYLIIINFIYISRYYSASTKEVAYSSKIYDLIAFVKKEKVKFICLDVDICNQLLSFTQQTGKYLEPFGYLDPQTYNNSFIKLAKNFNDSNILYIAHSNANSHFLDLKFRFFRFVMETKATSVKVKEFKDGGNTIFEIYKISNK